MKNNEVIDNLCKRSFVFAVIGTCIAGICPALGIMSLVIARVLKNKGVELSEENADKIKKAKILSVISLAMFLLDIVIAFVFYKVLNS